MSSELISLADSSDDEVPSSVQQKNNLSEFDTSNQCTLSDLLMEIQTEMQNGSTCMGDDDSMLQLDNSVDTSSDINSLVHHIDVSGFSEDAGTVTVPNGLSNGRHGDSDDERHAHSEPRPEFGDAVAHGYDDDTPVCDENEAVVAIHGRGDGEKPGHGDSDADLLIYGCGDVVVEDNGEQEPDHNGHDAYVSHHGDSNEGEEPAREEDDRHTLIYGRGDEDGHGYSDDEERRECGDVHEEMPVCEDGDAAERFGVPEWGDSMDGMVRELSPEVVREPSPEVVREPSPEVVREPSPEVAREPSPEVVRELSPEVVRELSPEVVREHSPEVAREPSPVKRRSVGSDSEEELDTTNDSHHEQYSTEPSTQTCDEEVTEKTHEPAENYHTQSTENYRRDEKTYGTNLQSVEDHEQEKPCDMLEEVETKIPTPAVRQNVPSNQETRTISEDDMTKSPSCSESENEEVVEDGEVVYRSNDETHTSDVRREIPKYRDNIITGTEPGDIGDRLVLFEDYEHSHKTSKEEVSPGKINSPFISGGLQSSANAQAKDDIKFTDMANFRGKFEGGHMDHHHEAKAPRTITPPRDHEKTEFCNEDLERDPTIVRSDEMVNEDEYMPKAGSSQMIVQRFKQASTQERDYRPVRSVKDEIHSTAKVEYENQPERFEQWQNKTEGGIYENEPNYRPDVMREQDPKNYEAELPEVGYTRNVLQHFKTIQSDDRQQGKSIRRELTPPMSDQVEFSNEPSRGIELYEGKPEAGIFESQPQIREDVVHADEGEEIVLPEQGYARNVAKMFRQMSEGGGPQTPKSQKEFTPPRDASPMVESMPAVQAAVRESDEVDAAMPCQGSTRDLARRFQQMQHEDAPRSADHRIDTGASSNAGVYENHPEVNQSVVHADDQLEEQLPEQGLARNLVAQFRQMESGGHQRQSQGLKSKEFTPPREEPRIVELRQRASSGGVQPDDIPEQYHLQAEHGGVFESQPDQRSDVMREADTDWDDGLPTPDTTKNLVARFKNIQQNAHEDSQTPKPINRKESPPSVRFQMAQTAHPLPTATSTPSYKVATPSNTVATSSNQDRPARFHVIQLEKCDACNKTVYITERFEFNKCVYHKTCFKCAHCRRTLTPATYAVNEHQLYCMTHYKQMFKTKGNYDEGFGRTQYKKRWQSEPNLSTSSDEEITTSSYHR